MKPYEIALLSSIIALITALVVKWIDIRQERTRKLQSDSNRQDTAFVQMTQTAFDSLLTQVKSYQAQVLLFQEEIIQLKRTLLDARSKILDLETKIQNLEFRIVGYVGEIKELKEKIAQLESEIATSGGTH